MTTSTKYHTQRTASFLRRRSQRGATLVEFALFFLLFLVVAFGLMEIGRRVWTFTAIAHADRAGARFAVIHGEINPIPNDGTMIEDVVKANAVGLNPGTSPLSQSMSATTKSGAPGRQGQATTSAVMLWK